MHKFVIAALRDKSFLVQYTATPHKSINVKEIAININKRCKVYWKFLPLKFDFNAEIQNFIEYFYPLNLYLNADFQKFNTEILFTPSYLELYFFSSQKFAMGTHQKGLVEALLMSALNMFLGRNKKQTYLNTPLIWS